VPHLVEALAEKDVTVARTAHEFLRPLSPKEIPPEAERWREWWAGSGAEFRFPDAGKLAKAEGKGPYAATPAGLFEGLDVAVLESRADHAEELLARLGIERRIVRAAGIAKAGLSPSVVFVSNCTGEVQEEDVARLQWFVRVGGAVCASCRALQHTVELVWPGYVRKVATKGEVVGEVSASPAPGDAPLLAGVFPASSLPVHSLYGSHLIDVLRPEAVEVLVDSPEAMVRWGGGNLAAWFPAGHGTVFHTASHFDLQGLERVTGLKTAQDRIAWAVDHMGFEWDEVRKLSEERIWDSQAKSVERARDLSSFRLLSNVVRRKRLADLGD
jgi:hypothetical protein